MNSNVGGHNAFISKLVTTLSQHAVKYFNSFFPIVKLHFVIGMDNKPF